MNAPILLYGFFSLKFGIFASNQALKEMTNFGFLTKKTEDEFDNIL
ncbi:hypothetical protein IMCC9480_664 [Oxalobacteraceae bacterium IMCC9480]|nr:hypothetical protein IMCC9480_664 [Oxalobacteraceae bacterium IMCC9480]